MNCKYFYWRTFCIYTSIVETYISYKKRVLIYFCFRDTTKAMISKVALTRGGAHSSYIHSPTAIGLMSIITQIELFKTATQLKVSPWNWECLKWHVLEYYFSLIDQITVTKLWKPSKSERAYCFVIRKLILLTCNLAQTLN